MIEDEYVLLTCANSLTRNNFLEKMELRTFAAVLSCLLCYVCRSCYGKNFMTDFSLTQASSSLSQEMNFGALNLRASIFHDFSLF